MDIARASPVLRIDLASTQPVYEQIANGFRTMFVRGDFRPGDRIPSVRRLAIDLGIHHNTVAQAYRALAEEGWLELKRGRGAMVIERQRQKADARTRQGFIRHLEHLAAKAIADGVPKSAIAEQLAALVRKMGDL